MSNTSYKSPLCSCVICHKINSAKGIHSHYLLHDAERKSQHAAIAKLARSKFQHPNVSNKHKKIAEYFKHPSKCIECEAPISYDYRNIAKFCSRSCSAKFNNKKRNESGWRHTDSARCSISNAATGTTRKKFTRVSQCINCQKWHPGTRKTCSPQCRSAAATKNALANNLGKNGIRSGKTSYTVDSYGTPVRLESTFESKCAALLEELKVNWCRPKPLLYTLHGKTHNYYPDFYLPDLDLYLDPKNDFLIKRDYEKIQAVIQQNSVKVVVLPLKHIHLGFLSSLCSGIESNDVL